MKTLIDSILDYHKLRERFNSHENAIVRIQPLKPCELEIRKHGANVFLGEITNSDYLSIAQDFTYKTEMEFEILPNGLWTPVYLKEPHKRGNRSVEYLAGCREIRPIRLKRQISFSNSWSHQLKLRDYPIGILRKSHFW